MVSGSHIETGGQAGRHGALEAALAFLLHIRSCTQSFGTRLSKLRARGLAASHRHWRLAEYLTCLGVRRSLENELDLSIPVEVDIFRLDDTQGIECCMR